MRGKILMSLAALALSVSALATASPAYAASKSATSLFSSEANARDVCGKGKVVWVIFDDDHFYRPGSPGYEKGKQERKGAYTCERVARAKGWELGS